MPESPSAGAVDRDGVTFVIPVLNGREHLREVLEAVCAEAARFPFEIIVVDDGSGDESANVARSLNSTALRVIDGPRSGAAAAINAGIREARFPIICQVDQDVVIQPGWLPTLLEALQEQHTGAAQGRYLVPSTAGFWARAAGRDLDLRYHDLSGRETDHACTGNTAYRAKALRDVGYFDESLGYGYDNDLSYRLRHAGWRIAFCPEARADHYWRDSIRGYFTQQFGVGYGRIDVVRRHPDRFAGDAVSGPIMMLHAPAALTALVLLCAGVISRLAGGGAAGRNALLGGAILVALLGAERTIAGWRAWRHTGDHAALLFGVTHLVRDAAWAWAILLWSARAMTGATRSPEHSMQRIPHP